MYHDQGQIAMKPMGNDRRITIGGGPPAPVATCSHGAAYDMAGKGIAAIGSFTNAVYFYSQISACRIMAGMSRK
jgi:4-phospho-D-threonate 3-dehydrogenase / 4-phospho-D-erythronate 3-dehydrogenase